MQHPPAVAETIEIPITLIDVGKQQVRSMPEDESIGELAESISAKGLLQPIGVTKRKSGRYQLRWGHRRLLAHLRLGRSNIRATIYDGSEASIKGLALIENLHRSQMTLQDEVTTVTYLIEEEEKSVEQISQILNKGRQWVLDRVAIPNLPLFMREPLLDGDLPLSHVEIISRVPDEGAQRYLVATSISARWNKSQLKIIADCYMTPTPQEPPYPTGAGSVQVNPISKPFLYTCEMCGEKDTLEKFTLVRIHANGEGCRTTDDRSASPSHTSDGMADNPDRPNGEHHQDSGRTIEAPIESPTPATIFVGERQTREE